MLGSLYLLVYMAAGAVIARALVPRLRPLARLWLGACVGVFLMMWLPALLAFALPFDVLAHVLSLPLLAAVTAGAWFWRDKNAAVRGWDDAERRLLKLLLMVCVPLTLLGGYLQWTHCLNPVDGTLHVGQATYGDLPLHLSIITSLRGARFPADYNILPGELLSYPFLMDSLSTSFMVLGSGLRAAVVVPGTVCMALVFSGYFLLATRMADTRRAALLATLFVFVNGGLGFLYTFDIAGGELGARLTDVLEGWYHTPTNHADFAVYNLRWSNIIADMLVPQRTFLGGWTILLPCVYLLYDGLRQNARNTRQFALLGVLAGGLPLIHTHSFLALGLMSAGWLIYSLVKKKDVKHILLYGTIACALAAPQLIIWTFRQTSGNARFVRFQFNWVNNPDGAGLRDGYLWFWLKNVGLPLLLLVLALLEKSEKRRFIASGAFCIFIVAELLLFQPNEYDNNKLFYVWWALCAVLAADYAVAFMERLRGMRSRRVLGALGLVVCLLSGALSIARECVSDYQMFSRGDVAVATYIEENTEKDAVFMTWTDHINPVSSLAGRTIVCGPGLWLYWHGFDLAEREGDIRAFYHDPAGERAVLEKYSVTYIVVGERERAALVIDEAALEREYVRVYDDGLYAVYKVGA